MPLYSISIIQFDDISPGFPTGETVGGSVEGNTYTVSPSATPIKIRIEDDDDEFDDGFIDPPGNSTAANNQLVAAPVTINGVAYGPPTLGGTPQDQIELEFAFETEEGDDYYVVRIDGVNVGLTGRNLPPPGDTFTIDDTSDGQEERYDDIPCFAAGTEILTPHGRVAVERLRSGMWVETLDRGPQPLRRVYRTRVQQHQLSAMPELRPIVFAPAVLGNDREMKLSPQHRVLVQGWRAELLFGEPEVLVPAKALVGVAGVTVAPADEEVTYFHLLLDHHELVFSNGAVTESLLPRGRLAQALAVNDLAQLARIFGRHGTAERGTGPARPLVSVREGALLCPACSGAERTH